MCFEAVGRYFVQENYGSSVCANGLNTYEQAALLDVVEAGQKLHDQTCLGHVAKTQTSAARRWHTDTACAATAANVYLSVNADTSSRLPILVMYGIYSIPKLHNQLNCYFTPRGC